MVVDEDARPDLRANLASLGSGALADLRKVLEEPEAYRQFIAPPELADLAAFFAMANSDEVDRLQLLRAILDIGT